MDYKPCDVCGGRGTIQESNKPAELDRLYDKYADSGIWNLGEAYDKANKEVGYKVIPCPKCSSDIA